MALLRHPELGLIIGDSDTMPLTRGDPRLNDPALKAALDAMILSPSGWRGIFTENNDEENPEPAISPVHGIIAAAGALVFADYLKKKAAGGSGSPNHPRIILGMDTRPTGTALADLMCRAFLASGCSVGFAFITAAPEIMAYVRGDRLPGGTVPVSGKAGGIGKIDGFGEIAGFVYISASHNPIGHNGLKFGLTDGGVLPGPEATLLIDSLRVYMNEKDPIGRTLEVLERADKEELRRVYAGAAAVKKKSLAAYLDFTREVVSGGRGELFEAIARNIRSQPLGILADMNGSARTLSIDGELLRSLGIGFHTMNGKPREIAHPIIPEGESLEPCRIHLEELHRQDPSVVLGYVPDCDGDRGNLVFWDEGEGRARTLDAQEVFALVCVSELAQLVWTGELRYDAKGNALTKAAVAVNGPTSMRIDRIAGAFDVSVFRAEVGEANVVGLARRLREKGYTVRVLGEGSNGGNITHPSAVRDPIDTVLALVKILTIKGEKGKPGVFEIWCGLSDQTEAFRPDFTLSDIIAALPAFVTAEVSSAEAKLRVQTRDHAALKNRYQELFLRDWEVKKGSLKGRYGITGWEVSAYIGTEEKRGIGRFGEAGTGGLKIIFKNDAGHGSASMWMRGSKTEPVFRILSDAEGSDRRLERELIEWQRNLVREADQSVSQADRG
ncbi:phosphoglucomutase [Spirochaetia bacterium]|nr:phosphoglucomutase [Spirochaetia bacterium]